MKVWKESLFWHQIGSVHRADGDIQARQTTMDSQTRNVNAWSEKALSDLNKTLSFVTQRQYYHGMGDLKPKHLLA